MPSCWLEAVVLLFGQTFGLAAEDVRFARTIERIQRIVTSELSKIAVVHLYAQGFRDQDLVNFELSLTNPSTIYEQENNSKWRERWERRWSRPWWNRIWDEVVIAAQIH